MARLSRSLELRWFIEGTCSSAIDEWARLVLGTEGHTEHRTDYYLRIENNQTTSVKLRDGKIEIKMRGNVSKLFSVSGTALGYATNWDKYQFAVEDHSALDSDMSSAHWIPVDKHRHSCLFTLSSNQSIVAVPGGQWLERGFMAELTKLSIDGNHWWSIGCEAIGDYVSMVHQLAFFADFLMQSGSLPTFSLTDCYDYPEWLSRSS